MAITVNWAAKIINVPLSYLTLVSGTVYEMDIDQFRKDLKALESSVEGMPFEDTHSHNTEVTISGFTLSRVVEIINGYTVTFEDGQYAVNLIGANSNIADVSNVNQVSIRSRNSAGLVTVTSGSGVTEQDKLDIADRVWDELLTEHTNDGSFGARISKLLTKIQSLFFK